MTEDFPRILCRLRKERRLNQRTAASALHISQALLSHYENGLREPGLSFVDAACRYYGVSADYLLGRSPVRTSFAAEDLSPALGRLAEIGASSLLAVVEGLREADDEQIGDWEEMLSVLSYAFLRPFDAEDSSRIPGELVHSLSLAALGLRLNRALEARGEAGLSFTVPEAVKKQAEELLLSLREEWT